VDPNDPAILDHDRRVQHHALVAACVDRAIGRGLIVDRGDHMGRDHAADRRGISEFPMPRGLGVIIFQE
jgi:hypothetical protein